MLSFCVNLVTDLQSVRSKDTTIDFLHLLIGSGHHSRAQRDIIDTSQVLHYVTGWTASLRFRETPDSRSSSFKISHQFWHYSSLWLSHSIEPCPNWVVFVSFCVVVFDQPLVGPLHPTLCPNNASIWADSRKCSASSWRWTCFWLLWHWIMLKCDWQQMMGPEAMGVANANLVWSDEKVCRNFQCGTCPHALFTNTVGLLNSSVILTQTHESPQWHRKWIWAPVPNHIRNA